MRYDSWTIREPKDAEVNSLCSSGVSILPALILSAREMQTDVGEFFDTSISNLHDPFLLSGMAEAVERIKLAVLMSERIAVYGDYDVDGITSVAIVTEYLKGIGADCFWYIPDRMEEGYGLNSSALQTLRDRGASLVITVDSGVTAINEARYAADIGLDLIITDHHECKDTLPECAALINPRVHDNTYPFDELAGVGVAFKLLCALSQDSEDTVKRFGALTAIGTVADVMPLVGENRIIVHHGLKLLAKTSNLGLLALIEEAGAADRRLNAITIGYVLAPRINAAGRMGKAGIAVDLLLTKNPLEAKSLAQKLCDLNKERQIVETKIFEEAIKMLPTLPEGEKYPCIVLEAGHWHSGIVGIVASRLTERFGCPAFLICVDGDVGKGSARSVCGINLVEALSANTALLRNFGGHALAAGFSVETQKIDALRQGLIAFCISQEVHTERSLTIDACLKPEWIETENVRKLQLLEPYGTANSQPLFMLSDFSLNKLTAIGNGKHVRMKLERDNYSFNAIWFGMEKEALAPYSGDKIDAAFTLDINRFRDEESIQLQLVDVRFSAANPDDVSQEQELYARLQARGRLATDEAKSLLPERQHFAFVWRALRLDTMQELSGTELARRIVNAWRTEGQRGAESCKPMSYAMVWVILDIFEEFSLISIEKAAAWKINISTAAAKSDLTKSKILLRISEA